MRAYGPRGRKVVAGRTTPRAGCTAALAPRHAGGVQRRRRARAGDRPLLERTRRRGQAAGAARRRDRQGAQAGPARRPRRGRGVPVAAFRVAGRSQAPDPRRRQGAGQRLREGQLDPLLRQDLRLRPRPHQGCGSAPPAPPATTPGPWTRTATARAEAVFVGKYLLRRTGPPAACCRASAADHVDSMVVADLDPAGAGSRRWRWARQAPALRRRHLHLALADLPTRPSATRSRPGPPTSRRAPGLAPNLLVTTKLNPSETTLSWAAMRTYVLNATGQVGRQLRGRRRPVRGPGAEREPGRGAAAEDRLTAFGQVVDREGPAAAGHGLVLGPAGADAGGGGSRPRATSGRGPRSRSTSTTTGATS